MSGGDGLEHGAKPEIKHFRLPTIIIFSILIFAFGVVAAIDPLGAGGLPLSILAAALLASLALDARGNGAIFFALGGISMIVSIAFFVVGGESVSEAIRHALGAVYPTAFAFPVWATVRRGYGRSVSIGMSAALGTMLWLIIAALDVYALTGTLDAESVRVFIDECFEPMRDTLSGLKLQTFSGGQALLSESDIESLIVNVKMLLPGTIISVMVVSAYLVTVGVRIVANTFELSGMLPVTRCLVIRRRPIQPGESQSTDSAPDSPRRVGGPVEAEISFHDVCWRIELDTVSAVVFIAAYLFSVLFSSSGGKTLPLAAAAQNLVIILSPGFIYCGLREIFHPTGNGRKGCFLIALSVVLAILNPLTLVLLLSVVGVTAVLRESRARGQIAKNGKE